MKSFTLFHLISIGFSLQHNKQSKPFDWAYHILEKCKYSIFYVIFFFFFCWALIQAVPRLGIIEEKLIHAFCRCIAINKLEKI